MGSGGVTKSEFGTVVASQNDSRGMIVLQAAGMQEIFV